MSHLLADAPLAPVPTPMPAHIPAAAPAAQPGRPAWAGTTDRRRPGRIDNASPELIALMRKPSRAARMRVALYDAPGFMLQPEQRAAVTARDLGHMVVALGACSAACAAAFKFMLVAWG